MSNQIVMHRSIGKEYKNYDEYLDHQKKKTNDPNRRKKWLGKEWKYKIDIFQNKFSEYQDNKILKDKDNCICLGARTGQEVVALQNLNMNAIGTDIVPHEPYVILGDIHNIDFEDNAFDFVYTNIFDHSIYPDKFINEIERILKPNGHCLIHLEISKGSDKYAENHINNSNDVIKLFKNCKKIIDKKIPNMLGMNWELLIQKL